MGHLFTGALPPPACDAVFALLHEHGYPFERLPDRPTVNLIPLLVRYMRATHLPWEGLSVDDPDPVPLPLRETPVYRALLSLGPAAVEALLREAHVRGSLASTAALGALLGDLAADPAVRRRIAEALLAGPGFDYMHIITRSVLQQHGDLALLRHMLDALYPRFDPAAYHLAAALVYLLADMGTPDDLPRLRQWTQAGSPPLADLARRIHDRLAGGGVQFALV
ncbi:MAG: hypothetical protein ACFB51_09875 [Anaerolineae bacterium]